MARTSRPEAMTVQRRDAADEASGNHPPEGTRLHCRQTARELRVSLRQWARIERYSDPRRKPFGDALVPMSNRVEHEFDSGGDAQLAENAEKIFLDGVFA